MEVAMPMTGSAIDCYEDMFKEITRKLYGEDGLPDLTTTERLPSTGTDRGLTPIDYEVENPILKPEEHLTAFGLAALMQNGFSASGILNSTFPTHKSAVGLSLNPPALEDKWLNSEEALQWTQSKIATYNPSQKLFRCSECESVGYLHRVAEHWLGTHSNLRAFHCPQCSYESAWARCVRIHLGRQHNINIDESCDALTKDNPVLQDIVKYLQRLKNKIDAGTNSKANTTAGNHTVPSEEYQNLASAGNISGNLSQNSGVANAETPLSSNKRYSCSYCPYATDRRDLFTRHENIHREEKPFQCYVCQKQFNRADHVKKHFLRMHRDHPYDLNRIRRHPPKNASGMSYYQKYNSTTPVVPSETMNSLSTISSLSIPGFNGVSRSPTVPGIRQSDHKSVGKSGLSSKSSKKKGEKRFTCCYCSWSGVDNWCLKRHMNTHLKPFVCGLCDYKAARSERLSTHVLKVHNKRACAKCNFLADDLAQLTAHQQEQHPLESRNRALSGMSNTNSSTNILRNNAFNNATTTPSATVTSSMTTSNSNNGSSLCSQTPSLLKNSDITAAAAQILQHNRFLHNEVKSWKSQLPKQHGAARLFNYMEASDGSEPETDSPSRSSTAEDMSNRVNLTHRIQSDFLEAGGVEASQPDAEEEAGGEETELPLFVCQTCGCEFEDDLSLETHQFTHRHVATSPAKSEDAKENVDPHRKYCCKLCNASFESQNSIMAHMAVHTSLTGKSVVLPIPPSNNSNKRSRKQSKPKKVVIPYWDSDEVEVLRHLNNKLRKWKGFLTGESPLNTSKLVDKYMAQLVTRKGLTCRICRRSGVSRYHTRASLALHHYWKHSKKRFRCEHCNMTFKHRYQTILHSGRVHTEQNNSKQPNSSGNMAVMMPQIKEATHLSLDNVSASDLNSFTNFFNTSHNVGVPDANMSNAHKLGMSFFDHSFIHNNVVNNHMPIIIPTFQPN
ncbi:hypothetical protein GWI33_019599 [Rhynchophorus ferrugineus]|uniref:C2H2-type domain-containing protein n=1 Tax=Rhynchophorus ferrugineus TaxID=354439 RepID=A0A834I4Y8_RHYFE|nr:hypothetical protein GWI33_019599 [Rhynchophorus ferrugineus]